MHIFTLKHVHTMLGEICRTYVSTYKDRIFLLSKDINVYSHMCLYIYSQSTSLEGITDELFI